MAGDHANVRASLLALFMLFGACAERGDERPVESATAAVAIRPPWLLNANAPIPSNGGLLIGTQFGDEPTVDVRAASAPDVPIAGSVRKVEGYWVWVADSPLPEGSYTATISDVNFANEQPLPFEVTGERVFQKPALTSTPQIAISELYSEYACCWSLVNGMKSDSTCFTVELQDGVLLSPNVATSESASTLTQLLFEVAPVGQPGYATAEPFGYGPTAFSLEMQADAYCFDVTVIEIATGERYTFDEDDLQLCAPHGDLRELGTRSLEPSAMELDATVCHAPPEGFEASWCELNEAPCTTDPGRVGCELTGYVCRGEPLPGTVTTGGTGGMVNPGGAGGSSGTSGGAAGESGASGSAGAASNPAAGRGGDGAGAGSDDENEAPDEGLRASGCGCRVDSSHAGATWPALALIGWALGLTRIAARSRARARSAPGRSP